MRPEKIISGGQTGVDRAALDVAMFLEIPHGGWCPQGRRSEAGPIPDCYQVRETQSTEYPVRTLQNILDADGTLILYQNRLTGGTELTRRLARRHRRALHLQRLEPEPDDVELELAWRRFHDWIANHNILVLNVAGPRESTTPGIARLAERWLVRALEVTH